MRRLALIALLAGTCAVTTASRDYEPIVSQNETLRIMYGLPEGVEVEKIPTRLGFCGETAVVVMDEYGFQIWCGEYTFMKPMLRREGCFGEFLEKRILLTEITDKWTDVDCNGIIELYQPSSGNSVSYLDFSTVEMIEGMGMRVEGDIVENAARFFEAANEYAIILMDMDKEKAARLWSAYSARRPAEP
ncbi:MAG: hypothetical protein KJ955_05800 [Nanoarchaeota archaeon]|nr:hypothetical protein [Nanoarchaeota archaeon]